MVTLVSPGGALPKIFGLLSELQCLLFGKVGDVQIIHSFIYFLWLWTSFSTAFLTFKAFALAFALGGAGASFFTLGTIFVKRGEFTIYLLFSRFQREARFGYH